MIEVLYTHEWKQNNETCWNCFKKGSGGVNRGGEFDPGTLYAYMEISQWKPFIQLIKIEEKKRLIWGMAVRFGIKTMVSFCIWKVRHNLYWKKIEERHFHTQSTHYMYGFDIHGFNQMQIKNVPEKSCVYTQYIRMFFLSLVPKHHSKTTIYIVFTLH
jgi:hypothetical protein